MPLLSSSKGKVATIWIIVGMVYTLLWAALFPIIGDELSFLRDYRNEIFYFTMFQVDVTVTMNLATAVLHSIVLSSLLLIVGIFWHQLYSLFVLPMDMKLKFSENFVLYVPLGTTFCVMIGMFIILNLDKFFV